MTAYSSIPTSKRIDLLDILRGFALLGILVTNVMEYSIDDSISTPPPELSVWTIGIVKALTSGSFYPMFSLLFGIGFAVWMDKSMKKNGGVWLFAWRSCVLFFLGYAFAIFIEGNSILITYALLSIPLLLFYKAGSKVLLISAIVFLSLGILHQPITQQVQNLRSPEVQALKQNQIRKKVQAYQAARKEAEKNKTFSSFVRARKLLFSNQLKKVYTLYDNSLPMIFSMFLLGVFCWRKGFFTAVEKHIIFWKKVFWLGLLIGAGGQLFVFVCGILGYKKVFTPDEDILRYIEIITNPILTFFYVSLIVLLIHKLKGRHDSILEALKATGRMPLSNFFLQFIIMAALMYPYGFGLKLFSYQLILVAFCIYLFQMLLSIWWLKHFIYGPMEWLWRSLTYLKLQSMKKVKQLAIRLFL